MSTGSKSFGIDPEGRVLITEAADTEVATKQVSVTSTATLLKSDDSSIKRRKLFLRNVSATVAYVGDINVSSANGFPLNQYDEVELDVNDTAQVYGFTASGTATIHVLELE